MEEGYRIPTIEEFVQGFEFEVAKDNKYVWMDTVDDNGKIIKETDEESRKRFKEKMDASPLIRTWRPSKVWWKRDPHEIITREVDGITYSYPGAINNIYKPFDEQSFIDQGLVRVKI